jgi:hypothetical protein
LPMLSARSSTTRCFTPSFSFSRDRSAPCTKRWEPLTSVLAYSPSFSERHHAVPFGAALPLALLVLPRFLGCERDRRDGGAVRGVVEFGVLAGEADNSELIHVHRCSPQIGFVVPSVLGHPKASGPAPKRGEVLCWGDRHCRMGFLREGRGAKKAERSGAPGEGSSAAVPKTEEGDEDTGERRTGTAHMPGER